MDLKELQIQVYDIPCSVSTKFVDVSKYDKLHISVKCSETADLVLFWKLENNDTTAVVYDLTGKNYNVYMVDVLGPQLKLEVKDPSPTPRFLTVIAHVSGCLREEHHKHGFLDNLKKSRRGSRKSCEYRSPRSAPKEDNVEIELALPPVVEEKKEEKKGIFRNFKINKKVPESPKHKCKCETMLPNLILGGNMLYSRFNNKLECLAPPPNDGRVYQLVCVNKQPSWSPMDDFEWKV